MNILQVLSSTDPTQGGVMEAARQTSQVLAQMGHQVEMASVDDPESPHLPSLAFPVHALGPGKTSYLYTPKLIPWLRANAARFDLVIVNGLWQYPGFAVRRALWGTGTPYFVYTHGMLDPWFKRAYPLKHLKKGLYWPWGEYRVLRDAKAVLFTCEEEKLLARQSFGLYQANEEVVSLGTAGPVGDPDAQREAFLSAFPVLRGRRVLLFLGRLHVKKGCDLLIEAFARVASSDPSLSLVMAGPDQTGWQADLERLASAQGVGDRVVWTGILAGELKWGAFYAAEVFLLPSHQENFGIAVAEALACGVPVLISDKVNIWREILADGAGRVASDDADGTARLIQERLALSEREKQAMRGRPLDCFERRYEIHRAVQNLLAVLGGEKEMVSMG